MSDVIPEAALRQHIGVLGKTGSGKTSTAKLAVEQVVATGSRVCVLDPIKSDWWGMIADRSGRHAGLEFNILGGPHGHVPLHSRAGRAVADLVAQPGTLPLSIIDMADFEAGGLQRFFIDFADQLLRKMRGVLYLVLEEAHEFAPKERAGFGEESKALHYAKKLATAGRSKGIRLIVVTHRVQSLHNAVLGSCETMIVHRLTAPADQEPIKKWLTANVADKDKRAEITGSMSSLKTGVGWMCSGEAGIIERVAFPRIATFDNSATPTDDDQARAIAGNHVDLDGLRSLIGAAVAEAEASDPKKLKARIAELEAAATKPATLTGTQILMAERATETYRKEFEAAKEGLVQMQKIGAALKAENERLRGLLDQTGEEMRTFRDRSEQLLTSMMRPLDEFLSSDFAEVPAAEQWPSAMHDRAHEELKNRTMSKALDKIPPAIKAGWPTVSTPVKTGDKFTGPQERILNSLAWWYAVGMREPEDAAVAAMANYAVSGGAYKNRKGELRAMGYIDYPREGFIALTELGLEFVVVPQITRREDLHATVLGRLTVPQRRILEPLLAAYPDSLSDDALAAAADYEPSGGAYKNRKGELRGMGFIDYPSRGVIVARNILFP